MKIGIVGPGLIGTSVALAARRAWPDAEVVSVDRGEPLERVTGCDVVVLSTPVDETLLLLRERASYLEDGLVLDTGSVKREIVAAARGAGLTNFVGGHPMAGGASSGPTSARADLFDGKLWLLVPLPDGAPALDRARSFVETLGAQAVVLDDDGAMHDRVMAAVSHLPQVAASALMKVAGDAAGASGLDWSGAGLYDSTRLAGSSAAVWRSILAANAGELRPLLVALADTLRDTADRLGDPAAVDELFAAANRYRAMLKQR